MPAPTTSGRRKPTAAQKAARKKKEEMLEDMIVSFQQNKKRITEIAEQNAGIEEEVFSLMGELGYDNEDGFEGVSFKSAKIVRGSRVLINEDSLLKKVGKVAFKRFTKSVVDRKLIEAALVNETLDPKVLEQCSTVEDNKPYLKVTP